MPVSSVLVGSRPAIPTTTLTVVANAVSEGLVFNTGDYYYDHATGALSLLSAVATLINTHSQLVGTSAICTRSLRTSLSNATAFSVNWGSDTTLRNLLGYSANLVSATSHVAPLVSPLLWAAGRPESSSALMASDGITVKDTHAGRSAPGVVVATTNNEWKENTLSWRNVLVDQIERVPDVGGTYNSFWGSVLSHHRRFWVSRGRTWDTSDTTTSIALTSSRIPAVGRAYILKHDGQMKREHERVIAFYEIYCHVEFPVETALEYGA